MATITDDDLLATLDSRLSTLLRDGNLARGPGFRSLGEGLWEVKAKSARLLYGFLPGAIIVVVAAAYKDQRRLPPRLIDAARRTLRHVRENMGIIRGTSYTH